MGFLGKLLKGVTKNGVHIDLGRRREKGRQHEAEIKTMFTTDEEVKAFFEAYKYSEFLIASITDPFPYYLVKTASIDGNFYVAMKMEEKLAADLKTAPDGEKHLQSIGGVTPFYLASGVNKFAERHSTAGTHFLQIVDGKAMENPIYLYPVKDTALIEKIKK